MRSRHHILGPGATTLTQQARQGLAVLQEVHGLMLAHYAVRRLIHRGGVARSNEDPDRLSFVHAVQVVQPPCRSTPAFPPSSPNERLRGAACWKRFWKSGWSPVDGQKKPRGVKPEDERLSTSRPWSDIPPQVGLDTAYRGDADI